MYCGLVMSADVCRHFQLWMSQLLQKVGKYLCESVRTVNRICRRYARFFEQTVLSVVVGPVLLPTARSIGGWRRTTEILLTMLVHRRPLDLPLQQVRPEISWNSYVYQNDNGSGLDRGLQYEGNSPLQIEKGSETSATKLSIVNSPRAIKAELNYYYYYRIQLTLPTMRL